ncbi:peptidoglycan D,D-transpeptidase FtsI family protein [Candidatus Margulisiibacteriota bacterium]
MKKRTWYLVRLWMIAGLFCLWTIPIIAKLANLQICNYDFFLLRSKKQRERTITIAASRGNIYDRNGKLLATSIDSYSAYLAPKLIRGRDDIQEIICNRFGIRRDELHALLKKSDYFVWIKRKLNLAQKEAVKDIPGVRFIVEKKRVYLQDSLGAHILGFVGLDNNGLSGVEQTLDKHLKGMPGKIITEVDPRGEQLFLASKQVEPEKPGDSIILTIDEFLQHSVTQELRKAKKIHNADAASAILIDIQTGEILALVSLPDYNPNIFWQSRDHSKRNTTTQTVFEPGSTLKPFTMAIALENRLINLDDTYENEVPFHYGGETIVEAHNDPSVRGMKRYRDIIRESLNVGAAKVGIKLGKESLYTGLKKFSFGTKTKVLLPGESAGIVRHFKEWHESDTAVISFGQGIAVTGLQLIRAMTAIANNGVMKELKIIKSIKSNTGKDIPIPQERSDEKQVISSSAAWEVRKMMMEAVETGTGRAAQVKGYSIAGKTGTAWKVNSQGTGYIPGHYVSSFIGIFPARKPQYILLVVVDNPKGDLRYGSHVAAPAFRNITKKAVIHLGIRPDQHPSGLTSNQ